MGQPGCAGFFRMMHVIMHILWLLQAAAERGRPINARRSLGAALQEREEWNEIHSRAL